MSAGIRRGTLQSPDQVMSKSKSSAYKSKSSASSFAEEESKEEVLPSLLDKKTLSPRSQKFSAVPGIRGMQGIVKAKSNPV